MSSDNDGFSNLEIAVYGVLAAAIVVIAIVLLATFLPTPKMQAPSQAVINHEVNETNESITVTVTSMVESDYVILRGDGPSAEVSVDGKRKDAHILIDEAGQTVTLTTDGGGLVKENGTVLVVSIKGEVGEVYSPVFAADDGRIDSSVKGVREVDEEAIQTTIVSIEYDFSE